MAKFGVEIEFITSRHADLGSVHSRGPILAEEMRAAGLAVEWAGYTHRTTAAWKLVYDSSVTNGFELVSPPTEMEDVEYAISTAVAALDAIGARVNKQCGLHVHHDATAMTAQQVASVVGMYGHYEEYLSGAMAPSRRDSRWAKPVRSYAEMFLNGAFETYEQVIRMLNGDRYHTVNVLSLMRHGTIEFRQHQGTTNAEKIINWVKITSGIVNRARRQNRRVRYTSHTENHRWVRETCGKDMAHYVRARRQEFGYAR
jgi:hypothetical protein